MAIPSGRGVPPAPAGSALLTALATREAAHPSRPQSTVGGRQPDPDAEALTSALIAITIAAGLTAAVLTGWVPTPLGP